MADWQLALELDPNITPAMEQLLEARGGQLSETIPEGLDTTAEHEWRMATFPTPVDLSLVDAVGSWLRHFGIPDARFFTRHAESAWAKAWRGVYSPLSVSARVWVVPSWTTPPDEAAVTVILDPSVAFGGGAHPTTVGMLNLLDKVLYETNAKQILDIGSGSAILALAAAKLGAHAVGVEIDAEAVSESLKNVRINGVEDRVEIRHGTMDAIHDGETFDIVVANAVSAAMITTVAPQIRAACRDHLLLTGFYSHHTQEVLQAYPGMKIAGQYAIRDWVMLHLQVDKDTQEAS